jgi:hypothetical protein
VRFSNFQVSPFGATVTEPGCLLIDGVRQGDAYGVNWDDLRMFVVLADSLVELPGQPSRFSVLSSRQFLSPSRR